MALFACGEHLSAVATAGPNTHSPSQIAASIIEASFAGGGEGSDGDVAISPDGEWVVYKITGASLVENRIATRLVVQRTVNGAPVTLVMDEASAPHWSPDGTMLAVAPSKGARQSSDIVIYGFRAGKLSKLRIASVNLGSDQGWDFKWSPDSKTIGIIAPDPNSDAETGLNPRRGVTDAEWRAHHGTCYQLTTYNIQQASLKKISPSGLCVSAEFSGGFDWSPNGKSVVVTVNNTRSDWGQFSRLVLLDIASGHQDNLVTLAGMNFRPLWSPDGQKIVFATQAGSPEYYSRDGFPGIFNLKSRQVLIFDHAPRGAPVRWQGENIFWRYQDRMTTSLARFDVNAAQMGAPLEPVSDADLPYDSNRSFSANGTTMAFTRSYFATPADVYFVHLSSDGSRVGTPAKITHFGDKVDFANRVSVRDFDWKSRDGLFTVHGLLALPRDKPGAHLPTLLYVTGGPGMVNRGFGDDGGGGNLRLAMALHGYAALVPNTRGRSGYGDAFLHGIRDMRSYARIPLNDALDGVSLLLNDGISDHARLAIAGHSYGGYLTEYALTQTRMFKAAVIHEGHLADLMKYFYGPYYPDYRRYLTRDLYGVTDPFNGSETRRLFEESPGFHPMRVKTPTLMLYGANSLAQEIGEPLYFQYQHFHVPSQLIVYDEEHVFQRPAAIADSIERSLTWIDKWLGEPAVH